MLIWYACEQGISAFHFMHQVDESITVGLFTMHWTCHVCFTSVELVPLCLRCKSSRQLKLRLRDTYCDRISCFTQIYYFVAVTLQRNTCFTLQEVFASSKRREDRITLQD